MKPESNSLQNEQWSHTIVNELCQHNITYYCLAPGSRSMPLTYAVSSRVDVNTMVHFDERGCGFYALGIAKAIQHPVAIITTSGTAVANLLPAVVEAFQSCIPLVILTADRPPELQGSGANQTIDQVGIFGKYVATQLPLGCPNQSVCHLKTAIQQAVRICVDSSQPIHVNCMFREPL